MLSYGQRTALVSVALAASVLLLAAPVLRFTYLKSRLASARMERVMLLERDIGVVHGIIAASKGYIIRDERALRSVVRINVLLSSPSRNAARLMRDREEAVGLARLVLSEARKYPRLMRDAGFVGLNNRFEEFSALYQKNRAECITLSAEAVRLSRLPVYGRFLRIEPENICGG